MLELVETIVKIERVTQLGRFQNLTQKISGTRPEISDIKN